MSPTRAVTPERATRPLTPSCDRLLHDQELGHHLRQRPAAGDQAQHPVLVETLHRSQIEGERLVQLVHHELGHLLDVARGGQARRQARRRAQLGAQVGQLASRRDALHALVGAIAAQRLGASRKLAPARRSGRLDGEFTHARVIDSKSPAT